MQPEAGNLLCSACGSHVETPAFFCDMCGVPFSEASAAAPEIAAMRAEPEPVRAAAASSGFTPSIGEVAPNTNAPSTQSPEVDWKELAIRIGIPVAVVTLGIFLNASKNKEAHTILLLLLPAMIGTIAGAANLEQVNLALEGINNWTVEKLATRKDGDGKRHRFFYRPWHWLLTRINTWAGSIENPLVRNGVTVGAYFYVLAFFVFLVYVALVIVVGIILLVIFGWIISMFDGGNAPSSARQPPANKKHGGGGGLFGTKCSACGSTEHASSDCPHGLFSSKCGACGSKDHATSDCPHGLFSSKCGACGSKDHATSDCPHGLFSSKCGACGSTEHATSNCPHGLFSSKCGVCGSKDHSTSACPH